MRNTIALIAILLAAASARAVYCFARVDGQAFHQIDGRDYADLASNLYHGRGYSISFYRWFEPTPSDPPPTHPEVYRPPLLPVLGAPLHALPGRWETWARTLQILLGTGCVAMVYLLAVALFGRGCGLLAAAGMAVYPFAIFYSGYWATESLFMLLLLTACWACAAFRARGSLGWALLAGVVMALATLARPNGLAVAAGMLAWLAVFAPKRKRLAAAGLFVLAMSSLLTPWTIRNYRVAGIVSPATAFGPYNFYLGNNPRMYEMYKARHTAEFPEIMARLYDEDSRSHVEQLTADGVWEPAAANAFWSREATQYMRANPGQAAYIWLSRLTHYWRPWPNRSTISRPLFWLAALTVTPMFLLAVIAIARRRRRDPAAVTLLLIAPVLGMLAALPFVFHLRLRFPTVDAFFLILAAYAITSLLPLRNNPSNQQPS